jgi:hypothetical protein
MVLAMLHWQERELPSPDLKARFERGNLVEDTVLRELSELGIKVRVERQPFEIRDKQGRLILRGKVDGFVSWQDAEYPMEVKSLDPNIFRQIETVEDFKRWIWASKYPRQIQAYLYANNLQDGFFLLDDCMGHWKLIPVTLDFEEMEKILQRCEKAVASVEMMKAYPGEESMLPEYHKDPAVCRRCWAFGKLCIPPLEYHGLTMKEDPEFEEMLNQRGALAFIAKEYEALDRKVKARLKEQTGLIIGDWLIEGEWKHKKAYQVAESDYWQTKITKTGE